MDDLISRQGAINEIKSVFDDILCGNVSVRKGLPEAVRRIEMMSSAELKRGKWFPCDKNGLFLTEAQRQLQKNGKSIWYGFKCSECGFIYKGNALTESEFCQRCGADMRGDTE